MGHKDQSNGNERLTGKQYTKELRRLQAEL